MCFSQKEDKGPEATPKAAAKQHREPVDLRILSRQGLLGKWCDGGCRNGDVGKDSRKVGDHWNREQGMEFLRLRKRKKMDWEGQARASWGAWHPLALKAQSELKKTPLGWILLSSTYTDKAWLWFKSSWTTVIPKEWSNTHSEDARKAWTLNCLPHPTPCQTRLRRLLGFLFFLICFVLFEGMRVVLFARLLWSSRD